MQVNEPSPKSLDQGFPNRFATSVAKLPIKYLSIHPQNAPPKITFGNLLPRICWDLHRIRRIHFLWSAEIRPNIDQTLYFWMLTLKISRNLTHSPFGFTWGVSKKVFFSCYILYIYKICIHKWTSCTRFWVGSQNNMVNPSHKLLDVAVVTSIWKIDGVATPLPQKNLNCVRGVRIAKTNTRVPGKRETSACRQTPWYLWEATNCRS